MDAGLMGNIDRWIVRAAVDNPPTAQPGTGGAVTVEIEIRIIDARKGGQHRLIPPVRPKRIPNAFVYFGPLGIVVILDVGRAEAEIDGGPRACHVKQIDGAIQGVHQTSIVGLDGDCAAPIGIIQTRLIFRKACIETPFVADVVVHAIGDIPVLNPPGISRLEVIYARQIVSRTIGFPEIIDSLYPGWVKSGRGDDVIWKESPADRRCGRIEYGGKRIVNCPQVTVGSAR